MKCERCGGNDILSYTCQRCGDEFCSEHRLPENHDCVSLKIEGMTNAEDDIDPWFKDEFALSNVGGSKSQFDRVESPEPENREPEDRYREANTSNACESCQNSLFGHEAFRCKYCDEVFCSEHLLGHRESCSENPRTADSAASSLSADSDDTRSYVEQKRKSEKLKEAAKRAEEKRMPDLEPTPDVAPDGSLVHPDQEEKDKDDQITDVQTSETTVRQKRLILAGIFLISVGAVVYLFYL